MTDMTPEQENAFYADPDNQEPQGPPVRRKAKLSEPVPVRFPEDLLQEVRDRAAADDRSVSNLDSRWVGWLCVGQCFASAVGAKALVTRRPRHEETRNSTELSELADAIRGSGIPASRYLRPASSIGISEAAGISSACGINIRHGKGRHGSIVEK